MKTNLPSSDLYHEAVQNPHLVFKDPHLKGGAIVKDGFGLPEVAGGGFALTYRIKGRGKDFAVRVFHKQSSDLADRYRHISNFLSTLNSAYFVGFEFLPNEILVQGQRFPVVRMDWVEGDTLGATIDDNISNAGLLGRLRSDLRVLGDHLAQKRMAHGDLQIDNILVTPAGLRLVDYDGMFVPGMPFRQSSELGQRNFQHPQRADRHFDHTLDRFSLILLDLSLEISAMRPALYRRFNTGNNIIFTTADLRDPGSSETFRTLFSDQPLRTSAERFAALCRSRFEDIPTFSDYTSGAWKPTAQVSVPPTASSNSRPAYVGAYPILDAHDYATASGRVGDQVELIGQITDVSTQFKRGKGGGSYIFINFGNWKGRITKVIIWPTHLPKFTPPPSPSWKGRWVSVTGLLTPPYHSSKHGYTHISIVATKPNQIHHITADEARYRLGKSAGAPRTVPASPATNREILESALGRRPVSQPLSPPPPRPVPPVTATRNQQILDQIKRTAPVQSTTKPPPSAQLAPPLAAPTSRPIHPPPKSAPQQPAPAKSDNNWGCAILIIIGILAFLLLKSK